MSRPGLRPKHENTRPSVISDDRQSQTSGRVEKRELKLVGLLLGRLRRAFGTYPTLRFGAFPVPTRLHRENREPPHLRFFTASIAAFRSSRLYPEELEASEVARASLDYLDKRRGNMRYGWLRRNGYCISSSHVEAAARILVARRCKQAGMHWRHHNAACVCAIIARMRSAA